MKIIRRTPLFYVGIIVSIAGLLGLNFTEAATFQTISMVVIISGLGLMIKGQIEVR